MKTQQTNKAESTSGFLEKVIAKTGDVPSNVPADMIKDSLKKILNRLICFLTYAICAKSKEWRILNDWAKAYPGRVMQDNAFCVQRMTQNRKVARMLLHGFVPLLCIDDLPWEYRISESNRLNEQAFIEANAESGSDRKAVIGAVDKLRELIVMHAETFQLAGYGKSLAERMLKNASKSTLSEFAIAIRSRRGFCRTDRNDLLRNIPYVPQPGGDKPINAFLEDNRPFLWYGLIGPGGSGKTRFAEHIVDSHNDGLRWTSIFLPPNIINGMLNDTYKDDNGGYRFPTDLLLVLDDAASIGKEKLRDFIKCFEGHDKYYRKIRLLLIEREGPTESGSVPAWFPEDCIELCYQRSKQDTCHRFDTTRKLGNRACEQLLNNFCCAVKKWNDKHTDNQDERYAPLTNEKKTAVYQKFVELDGKLRRPLYLLLLAAAASQGRNITDWCGLTDVQKYVMDREKRHIERMAAQVGDKTALTSSYVKLLTLATISGAIEWREIFNAYNIYDRESFLFSAIYGANPKQLENLIKNIGSRIGSVGASTIEPYQPDPAGAFWVHEVTSSMEFSLDDREALRHEAWRRNPERFNRFLFNYASDMRDTLCKGGKKILDHWIFKEPLEASEAYAEFLLNITILVMEEESELAVQTLKAIALEHPKVTEMQIMYAHGLVNLTFAQATEAARAQTLETLKAFAMEHTDVPRVQTAYAYGLVNLTIVQTNEAAFSQTVETLKAFAIEHPKVPQVQTAYAQGLFNLSHIQISEATRAQTVETLKTFAKEHPEVPQVQTEYAKGLFNLTRVQATEAACAQTVNTLKAFAKEHSDVPEVQTEYAKGLVNLTAVQTTEASRTQTVEILKAFTMEYPDVPEVQAAYANGLVNLTTVQTTEAAHAQTLETLKAFATEHPEVPQVQTAYANGLANLAAAQATEAARAQTVETLKAFAMEYPGVPQVQTAYANGLVNLAAIQTTEASHAQTMETLKAFAMEYPEVPGVQAAYAKGLVNLTAVQTSEAACAQTVETLEAFAKAHPDLSEVQAAHANGLVNLIAVQTSEAARAQTVETLEAFAIEHSKVLEVQAAYAKGLFNLAHIQTAEAACAQTVETLEAFAKAHPEVPEVQVTYAKGLFYLTVVQTSEAARAQTVERLEAFATEHPEVPEVQTEYVKGLFNLSVAQTSEAACVQTVEKLKALAKEHPEIPGVQMAYANGLFKLTSIQTSEAARAQTVETLEAFAKEHPDLSEVQAAYAKGLANLILLQAHSEIDAPTIKKKLRELANRYTSAKTLEADRDIADWLAKTGMFSLEEVLQQLRLVEHAMGGDPCIAEIQFLSYKVG